MKVAILGATGMLGSMVARIFAQNDHQIIATARNKADFTNEHEWKKLDAQTASIDEILNIIEGCSWVINCIGIIKPYIHDDNSYEVQRAIEVNGLFPHKLAKAAEESEAKVIQIATDCVYDGVKGHYVETDRHNATDVYGKSKSLGEVNSPNVINLRCSIIGPEARGKTSLLEWFLNQPQKAKLNGFLNHQWNGITTYHFAKICAGLINNNYELSHLQHIVPSDYISKAQILANFAEVFDRTDIKITNINATESINRTISTNNQKQNALIWKLAGYSQIPTIKEMVEELKCQMA